MLLGGLILALASLAASGSRFASRAIFVYLGEISYSTYMICIPWKILSVNLASRILNIEAMIIAASWLWIVIVALRLSRCPPSFHVIENRVERAMKSWASVGDMRRQNTAAAPDKHSFHPSPRRLWLSPSDAGEYPQHDETDEDPLGFPGRCRHDQPRCRCPARMADGYWQCVPFARLMSGIQIFGDARTWWSQAAGKYDTGLDAQDRLGAFLQAHRAA